jgi:hypothetical protein
MDIEFVFSGNKNTRNKTHTHAYFLQKKITFDLLNFLKLLVHVFCLAEQAKLCRTNNKTNCQQNKITICHLCYYTNKKNKYTNRCVVILYVYPRIGATKTRFYKMNTQMRHFRVGPLQQPSAPSFEYLRIHVLG